MYYDHNFALHTAHWHDGFGDPRSHGCVNLAPRDARLLYRWSSPDVPPGWIAVYGDADTPGSLVRVRSSEAREPAFRGYARTLPERATLTASE
jgi:L,D-transpeptidase catalytic domain